MEIFLDKASIIAIVCSAADIVFTSGVFITTIPPLVAAEISILSTPTPARPITRNLFAAFIAFGSIDVPLLTIHPAASTQAFNLSSTDALLSCTTLIFASSRIDIPDLVMGSVTRTFIGVIILTLASESNLAQIQR